jgi:hypothetical protein
MVFLRLNLMMIVDQDFDLMILNCHLSCLYQTENKISIHIVNFTTVLKRTEIMGILSLKIYTSIILNKSKTNFVSVIEESVFVGTVVPSLSSD